MHTMRCGYVQPQALIIAPPCGLNSRHFRLAWTIKPYCPHYGRVSWLEDGKWLITQCEYEIVLVTLEGEILRTFTLSGGSQKIYCYSSRGEFVVYLSILTCDRIMILQDIHTGITQELDIPTIPFGNFCSFTNFDKDKLLGIVCYGEKEYEKTNIFVWTGMPSKPHLCQSRNSHIIPSVISLMSNHITFMLLVRAASGAGSVLSLLH